MIHTQTICPICHMPLSAAYTEKDGSVFFEASCPEHGSFGALASDDAKNWENWIGYSSVCVPPKIPITSGADGECPLHCGVCNNHLMTACCVLLDVTERCNQHCPYCFASAGNPHAEDPSIETITHWYDRLIALGEERHFNIQLSGGEPTVREDLPEIIRIGKEKGFEYIQLNTNGRRIGMEDGYAASLRDAGLTTVFLQFDGTNDEIYQALRAEPLLNIKRRAIENCARAGLPVTLVPTIVAGVNDENVGEMIDFMLERLHVVKGIHFQPVSYFGRHPKQNTDYPYDRRAVPNTVHPDTNMSLTPDTDKLPRATMFSVMRAIEEQSGDRISRADLVPISTGHPLCCFCANFLRERGGKIVSLLTERQKDTGVSCCDSPENTIIAESACCSPARTTGHTPDSLELIRKDRDFVLHKWVVSDEPQDEPLVLGEAASIHRHCGLDSQSDPQSDAATDEPLSLDEAADYIRRNMFTISGMAFMDSSNLDAERLKRCRVQVFSRDGRLIPFCAYNAIYREAEARAITMEGR